jgi:RNA polymerase sigma-70 factor, ECF subfamily
MSAAPSIPESAATVEAAQAGLLYERYSSRILGYCRRRLSSHEEAEDAVQHTFLNAYRSLRTGVVPHAEAAWLYKIAENVCHERRRSAWRRSRIEVVSEDGEMRDAVAEPVRTHDELAGLADALGELTPNQRRAILLREWQGLSYREIAAELETTEAAIETLLFRARRSLARKLDRSRDRVWSGLDVGSLAAWGKSLLGGTAAKVATATVVVAAGVTAATPTPHEQVASGQPSLAKSSTPALAPAFVAPTTPQAPGSADVIAPPSSRSGALRAGTELRAATPAARRAPAPGAAAAAAAPAETGSTPAPPTSGTGPATATPPAPASVPVAVPVTVSPPPPPPVVQVDVPPLTVQVPPLPVQVPPLPPLPAVTVTVPALPIVPPLDLPGLPKLP